MKLANMIIYGPQLPILWLQCSKAGNRCLIPPPPFKALCGFWGHQTWMGFGDHKQNRHAKLALAGSINMGSTLTLPKNNPPPPGKALCGFWGHQTWVGLGDHKQNCHAKLAPAGSINMDASPLRNLASLSYHPLFPTVWTYEKSHNTYFFSPSCVEKQTKERGSLCDALKQNLF